MGQNSAQQVIQASLALLVHAEAKAGQKEISITVETNEGSGQSSKVAQERAMQGN